MADTLVDPVDALPATQRDPELNQPSGEPPEPMPEPPRAVSPRRFLLLLVALFLAGVATAAVLFLFVFRYEPTARAHVPAGANVVIRIEGADIVLFEPVRKHLLPMVLEDKPAATAPAKPSIAERLHDKSGVRLPVDVREIVVATMDGKSWVASFGGKISSGKFVKALAEIATEDGWPGYRLDGDVLVGPSVAVAQADDGTIIAGTDLAIVQTALPATEEGTRLGLPAQGAVAFVVTKPAWETVSSAGAIVPSAKALGGVFRGTGWFMLGQSPELVVRLEPKKGEDVAAIERGATELLANLRLLMLLGPDRVGEKEALRQAVVTRETGAVVVRAPWPYEGLDRGAGLMAQWLRGANAAGSGVLP